MSNDYAILSEALVKLKSDGRDNLREIIRNPKTQADG